MGWSNFTRQLAENCYAVCNGTSFPPWDPACIDVSRFTRHVPESARVDGPAAAPKHPGHLDQQALLFHLPKSKAAALKKTASPTDGAHWISTYDAMCAFLWRQLSRVRLGLHNPDLSSHPYFGEAVNMRPRIHNPDLPARVMRNVLCGALGDTAPVPRPSLAEVIASEEEYPLSKLAGYIRGLTESCTQEHMETLIEAIAPVRDKRSMSLRVDALPPMSVWVADHRPADVGGLDFGFGRPVTHRHLWGEHLSAGLVLIYPPKSLSSDPDEGFIFTVRVEKELVSKLIEDPEWSEYFEFRGID